LVEGAMTGGIAGLAAGLVTLVAGIAVVAAGRNTFAQIAPGVDAISCLAAAGLVFAAGLGLGSAAALFRGPPPLESWSREKKKGLPEGSPLEMLVRSAARVDDVGVHDPAGALPVLQRLLLHRELVAPARLDGDAGQQERAVLVAHAPRDAHDVLARDAVLAGLLEDLLEDPRDRHAVQVVGVVDIAVGAVLGHDAHVLLHARVVAPLGRV